MPNAFVTRRIIGLENYPDLDLDVWEGELPPPADQIISRAYQYPALVTMVTDRIDAALMDALPNLRIISQCAVGVNNIDLAAAKARGIQVGHTPGVLTDATADMAFALLMSSARYIVPGAEYVKEGKWKTWGPMLFLGQSVWESTLGIVGYGRIGQAVVARAKGFNMRILVYTRSVGIPDPGVEYVDLDTLLRESDFISLHTPLTPETHHLISTRELALMKPTATLINTARGEVIDPMALADALQKGRPGFAALDVTEPEPIPVTHPLLNLPNCLIVPHLGSATTQTRLAMTRIAMQNLIAGLQAKPLLHLASP